MGSAFCRACRRRSSSSHAAAHSGSASAVTCRAALHFPFVTAAFERIRHVHSLLRRRFGFDRDSRGSRVAAEFNVSNVDVQLVDIESRILRQVLDYAIADGLLVLSCTVTG